MLTPEGCQARTEKLMLLSLWAQHLENERSDASNSIPNMIFAGIGKPAYSANFDMIEAAKNYWNNVAGFSIDYGNLRGDLDARTLMAQSLTKWYGNKIEIEA